MAAHHSQMAEKCHNITTKVAGMSDADLDKIVPDNVCGVYPVGLTAVPRYGAPDMKANVPPELQEFVKITDD
jgi:hypothetical protein